MDGLPLVIMLGFAGARRLLPQGHGLSPEEQAAFQSSVQAGLRDCLQRLRTDLDPGSRNFLCGVSQVAIGADSLFTEACGTLLIPQRIFLPQPREEFLNAEGSRGPDFTEAERQTARALLAKAQVIEERVVSQASERPLRFQEANLEIARVSDVVVCLITEAVEGRPGGTEELLAIAERHGKPALEIRVGLKDGQAVFHETWHRREAFRVPEPPKEVAEAKLEVRGSLPSGAPCTAEAYLAALKEVGSTQANWRRKVFRWAALIIIGAHLLATLCAVLALNLDSLSLILPWLLGGELVLLLLGFVVHFRLHHSRGVRVWALSRLVAEIARSVRAVSGLRVPLDYLFSLPLPRSLRPLLRTLNVLHLASQRQAAAPASVTELAQAYLANRLDGPKGQIAYYTNGLEVAECRHRWASGVFYAATAGAFLATLVKFLAKLHYLPFLLPESSAAGLGAAAILLPVLAVGALSLAASFDLEGRIHTYEDTLSFLKEMHPRIAQARSEMEFNRLVVETEARLLGEVANWASRRAVLSVT